MIYQLLLVDRGSSLNPFSLPLNDAIPLHPAILRTCRQILHEARIILYSENVWEIRIWGESLLCENGDGGNGGKKAWSYKCDDFGEEAKEKFGRRLYDMKRFDIDILMDDEREYDYIKSTVSKLCDFLSELGSLQYVCVRFEVIMYGFWTRVSPSSVLESFTLLRANEVLLSVHGNPEVYEEYLSSVMTGSAPSDPFVRMYHALVAYVGLNGKLCESDLRKAYEAMVENDIEKFRHARECIIPILESIEGVEGHIANSKVALFEHDAAYDAQSDTSSDDSFWGETLRDLFEKKLKSP